MKCLKHDTVSKAGSNVCFYYTHLETNPRVAWPGDQLMLLQSGSLPRPDRTAPDWDAVIGPGRLLQNKHPLFKNKLGATVFICWHLRKKKCFKPAVNSMFVGRLNHGNLGAYVRPGDRDFLQSHRVWSVHPALSHAGSRRTRITTFTFAVKYSSSLSDGDTRRCLKSHHLCVFALFSFLSARC